MESSGIYFVEDFFTYYARSWHSQSLPTTKHQR